VAVHFSTTIFLPCFAPRAITWEKNKGTHPNSVKRGGKEVYSLRLRYDQDSNLKRQRRQAWNSNHDTTYWDDCNGVRYPSRIDCRQRRNGYVGIGDESSDRLGISINDGEVIMRFYLCVLCLFPTFTVAADVAEEVDERLAGRVFELLAGNDRTGLRR
jgi:hypothetical protein